MPTEPSPSLQDSLSAQLSLSPDAYPQKIDFVRDAALVVRLDASAYRTASFLDDRILGPATTGAWIPFARVAEAARRVTHGRPVHFIFHTGHVGSTLVSRLLDETEAVLSLREPLPLRTLADTHDALGRADSLVSDAQFDLALATFTTLWCARISADLGCRHQGDEQRRPARRVAPGASCGVAGDLHQPRAGALSRDAACRAELADRSPRARPRANPAAAVGC